LWWLWHLLGFWYLEQEVLEVTTTKSNVATVTRGDLTTLVSGSSNIVAEQTVSLSFQSTGIVNTIAVKEGDSVTKGQILAAI